MTTKNLLLRGIVSVVQLREKITNDSHSDVLSEISCTYYGIFNLYTLKWDEKTV